jgi:hypothetical protein
MTPASFMCATVLRVAKVGLDRRLTQSRHVDGRLEVAWLESTDRDERRHPVMRLLNNGVRREFTHHEVDGGRPTPREESKP